MKNIKTILFGAFAALLATGCVSDDDFHTPPLDEVIFSQNFDEAVDNTPLDITGWTNFASQGTTKWTEQVFSGNGYAEFSTFNSGNPVNVGWLISPAINIDGSAKKLTFVAAQHHLDSPANKLEVLVSTNFDGTDVAAATWTPVTATLPTQANDWYEFVSSGQVNLSAFSGNVYIAFRVTGSGTDTTLDGAYQIDNVKLF
ncbi:choice-of-anchor J domain-containing protein [Flavobacterium sp. DGU11]|uniref:Choice-of-anchor J domain-containing protein n=1 Tax=Flavobacterium arundinis TaxID=3139143 RepID=A0ABU9HY92_9FLAO